MRRDCLRMGNMGYFEFTGGGAPSELGFTAECHLIEMVNANCFLNTVKTRKHSKAQNYCPQRAVENGGNHTSALYLRFFDKFMHSFGEPFL